MCFHTTQSPLVYWTSIGGLIFPTNGDLSLWGSLKIQLAFGDGIIKPTAAFALVNNIEPTRASENDRFLEVVLEYSHGDSFLDVTACISPLRMPILLFDCFNFQCFCGQEYDHDQYGLGVCNQRCDGNPSTTCGGCE